MKIKRIFTIVLIVGLLVGGYFLLQELQKDQAPDDSSAAGNVTQPYKVGAYYFGTFGPGNAPWKMNKIEQVYGRRDWWGGVKDFYGAEPGVPKDTRGWEGDFTHLKPVIGYYDQSQQTVLEKHIMQAKENGLSYFNFYWYWNSQKNDEYLADGIDSFVKARNTRDMEFMISIVGAPGELKIPESQIDRVINLLIEKYIVKPNYLKINGRPVVFLMDSRGIGTGDAKQTIDFIARFKNIAYTKYKLDPYFLINIDLAFAKQVTNAEGYSCLNFYDSQNSYTKSYINQIKPKFNQFTDKPMLACAMQNFDERPRQDIEITNRNEVRYYRDFSLANYKKGLVEVKSYMDSKVNPLSKHLTLYAWNEWHEGGILEPDVKNKALYLNTAAQVFGLKVGTNSCRTSGDCNPYPPTKTVCSKFTYSAWSSCLNNKQTRTVKTSSPTGCTGGSPVLNRACTMPASTNNTNTNNAGVVCGSIDVNGDNMLTVLDFKAFLEVLGKTCKDVAVKTGCGGKDTNNDGKIDSTDFESFKLRYQKASCVL